MSNVNTKQQQQPPSPTPTLFIEQLGKIVDDYKQAKSNVPSQGQKGETVVQEKSSSLREESVALPKVYPGMALLAGDPAEAVTALRKELLSLRSGGRRGQLADYKHQYSTGGNNFVATQQAYPLAFIPGGTAVDTRSTNKIRLRRIRIHMMVSRIPPNNSGFTPTSARPPTLHINIFRDKLPIIPGTAPTLYATDTDPPSSLSAMFSGVGVSVPAGMDLAVRNPINENEYHLYYHKKIFFENTDAQLIQDPASPAPPGSFPLWLPTSRVWHHSLELDLNVTQNYATYAASNPDDNALWLCIQSTTSTSPYNYNERFDFIADCEFEDIQDG